MAMPTTMQSVTITEAIVLQVNCGLEANVIDNPVAGG
eukprot:CAMPEP_0183771750 /NCGR_PEP_ID=MMETSP0739-20130205/33665_1 /TAXON_ID=385413 /ORGANISM="Thalassiosira miniscula, Strain CCMP1093" /LENGTH=36 /DNA_ID= /DNA_START= /DNA_END= /DNA_ORIENTATION=